MDKNITRRGILFASFISLLGFGLGVYHAVTGIPAGCRGGGLSTCGDGRTTGVALMLITGFFLFMGVYRWRQLNQRDSLKKEGE